MDIKDFVEYVDENGGIENAIEKAYPSGGCRLSNQPEKFGDPDELTWLSCWPGHEDGAWEDDDVKRAELDKHTAVELCRDWAKKYALPDLLGIAQRVEAGQVAGEDILPEVARLCRGRLGRVRGVQRGLPWDVGPP